MITCSKIFIDTLVVSQSLPKTRTIDESFFSALYCNLTFLSEASATVLCVSMMTGVRLEVRLCCCTRFPVTDASLPLN